VRIAARSADTTEDAERVQVELLRATPVERRLGIALRLSATVIGLARRGIERADSTASSEERDIRFVELHYGAELAAGLRDELRRRHAAQTRMTDSDVVAAVGPVADALDGLGVPYFLGGSLASSTHGIARASIDADVIAALRIEHVDPLVEQLHLAYYIPVDRLRRAVMTRSSCNFIHLATMFKVDVFVAKDREYDRQAAARARPQPLQDSPDERRFPVASAEDTVLAKLEWFRLGGEVSERQWWDIIGVLKVSRGADETYLRRWASALGVADLLDRALVDARS
jgi:hypothetical protein